jgi:hypothetical protein
MESLAGREVPMYYGDEKKRQMARSILPSKRGGTAKSNLQAIRRNKRRAARQDLRLMVAEENYGEFTERDLYRDENTDIRREVGERRDADKLTHFLTWAVKVTDGMDPDARMAHMVKILPDNLIGWHARSHLQFVDEFELNVVRWEGYGGRYRSKRPHPFQHRFVEKKLDLAVALREIIKDTEARDALQSYMQGKHEPCVWVTSYGVPHRDRVEIFHPPRKSPYSKHFRRGGYWEVTLTVTPNVLAERAVGPSRPPFVPSRTEGLVEFLDALKDSSEAAKTVLSPGGPWWHEEKSTQRMITERGVGPETCIFWMVGPERKNLKTRKNPDHHPEWLRAVTGFCEAWVESDGDLYSTLVALR